MQFSTYIFSADISPEMLKLRRVTKVKVLFLVMVFVLNFDLFKFSAAILEKGLLPKVKRTRRLIAVSVGCVSLYVTLFAKTRHKR